VFIAGHIHGAYGVKFHDGWTAVNAAVLDNDFCHVNPTVVVDLPLRTAPNPPPQARADLSSP
jgi:hypothetical protein